jgi:hypothetical protein
MFHIWNGITGREVILALLAYTPLDSFTGQLRRKRGETGRLTIYRLIRIHFPVHGGSCVG